MSFNRYVRMLAVCGSACGAFGILVTANTASAQSNFAMEDTTSYATVRGWSVYKFKDRQTGDDGCKAVKSENGYPVVMRYFQDSGGRQAARWTMSTTTNQTGVFGGGILGIDKADIDSQFGFREGWATMEVSNQILSSIKSGRMLTFEVNGDAPKYFSLHGSTAAALKVEECLSTGGRPPARQAAQPTPTPAPSASVAQNTFEICSFGGIRSTDGAPISVTFEAAARLRGPVELLWIDQNGGTHSYGILQPGQSTVVDTFVGHEWVGREFDSCSYARMANGLTKVVYDYD